MAKEPELVFDMDDFAICNQPKERQKSSPPKSIYKAFISKLKQEELDKRKAKVRQQYYDLRSKSKTRNQYAPPVRQFMFSPKKIGSARPKLSHAYSPMVNKRLTPDKQVNTNQLYKILHKQAQFKHARERYLSAQKYVKEAKQVASSLTSPASTAVPTVQITADNATKLNKQQSAPVLKVKIPQSPAICLPIQKLKEKNDLTSILNLKTCRHDMIKQFPHLNIQESINSSPEMTHEKEIDTNRQIQTEREMNIEPIFEKDKLEDIEQQELQLARLAYTERSLVMDSIFDEPEVENQPDQATREIGTAITPRSEVMPDNPISPKTLQLIIKSDGTSVIRKNTENVRIAIPTRAQSRHVSVPCTPVLYKTSVRSTPFLQSSATSPRISPFQGQFKGNMVRRSPKSGLMFAQGNPLLQSKSKLFISKSRKRSKTRRRSSKPRM